MPPTKYFVLKIYKQINNPGIKLPIFNYAN